jgi:hypothetical protein
MTHSHKKLSKHSRKKSLKRSHSPSKNITRQIFFYFVDGPFEHRLNVKEQSIVHAPNSTLYVLGDMEGNIVQLYQWFLHKKLITKDLEWIGKQTYVIQCGDQVDSIRFEKYGNKINRKFGSFAPLFLKVEYMGKYEILASVALLFNFSSFGTLLYNVVTTRNASTLPYMWFYTNIMAQVLMIIYALFNGAYGIYLPTFVLLLGLLYMLFIKIYYENGDKNNDKINYKRDIIEGLIV